MVSSKAVMAFAAVLAVGGVVPSILGEDRSYRGVAPVPLAESAGQRQDLRLALRELQQARRDLSVANRGLQGRRGQVGPVGLEVEPAGQDLRAVVEHDSPHRPGVEAGESDADGG